MTRSLLAALLLAAVAACSSLNSKEDETLGWSAQRLYGEAKDAMAGRDWEKAIKYLEKLEGRYPIWPAARSIPRKTRPSAGPRSASTARRRTRWPAATGKKRSSISRSSRGAIRSGLQLAQFQGRRDPRLVRAAPLRRGEGRDGRPRLGKSDQVSREARGALSDLACSSLNSKEDETLGWSAQRLYGEAKDAMAGRDWEKAIKYLEKLEARYPIWPAARSIPRKTRPSAGPRSASTARRRTRWPAATGKKRSSISRSSRRAIPMDGTRSRRSSRWPTRTGRAASAPPASPRLTASSSSTPTIRTSTTPGI